MLDMSETSQRLVVPKHDASSESGNYLRTTLVTVHDS